MSELHKNCSQKYILEWRKFSRKKMTKIFAFTHFDFSLVYYKNDKSSLASYETKGSFVKIFGWHEVLVHFRVNFAKLFVFANMQLTSSSLPFRYYQFTVTHRQRPILTTLQYTCLFASLGGGLAEGKSIADAVYRADLHHYH